MIKVGLSGNRFSGQDTICDEFKKLGIPIFYADVVLKFIINQDFIMLDRIKDRVGAHVFVPPYVESSAVRSRTDFDKIIDCAEFDLMKAYDRFNKEHHNAIYTVFQSSILFERGWNKSNVDFSINIFCPRSFRIKRSGMEPAKANILLKNEIEDYEKNDAADCVIHNYGVHDYLSKVREIDTLMIENYIKTKQTFKVK